MWALVGVHPNDDQRLTIAPLDEHPALESNRPTAATANPGR